jgi:hypothetical protein
VGGWVGGWVALRMLEAARVWTDQITLSVRVNLAAVAVVGILAADDLARRSCADVVGR